MVDKLPARLLGARILQAGDAFDCQWPWHAEARTPTRRPRDPGWSSTLRLCVWYDGGTRRAATSSAVRSGATPLECQRRSVIRSARYYAGRDGAALAQRSVPTITLNRYSTVHRGLLPPC